MSRKVEVVEAIYPYVASQENQISLEVGEKIIVTEKDKSGWWIGRNAKGEMGLFPSNYVVSYESAEDEHSHSPDTAQFKEVRKKKKRETPKKGFVEADTPRKQYNSGNVQQDRVFGGRRGPVIKGPMMHLPEYAEEDAENSPSMHISKANRLLEELGLAEEDLKEDSGESEGEDAKEEFVPSPTRRKSINTGEAQKLKDELFKEKQEISTLKKQIEELNGKLSKETQQHTMTKHQLKVLGNQINKSLSDFKEMKSKYVKERSTRRKLQKHLESSGVRLDEIDSESDTASEEDVDEGSMFENMNLNSARGPPKETMFNAQELNTLREELTLKDKEVVDLRDQIKKLKADLKKTAASSKKPEPKPQAKPEPAPQVNVEKYTTKIAELEESVKEKVNEAKKYAAETKKYEAKLKEIQERLSESEKNREKFQKRALELESLHSQSVGSAEHMKVAATKAAKVSKGMSKLMGGIKVEIHSFKTDMTNLVGQLFNAVPNMMYQVEDVLMKYKKEQMERRKLFNKLQELRGNIRVVCRVRPLGVAAVEETEPSVFVLDEQALNLTDPYHNKENTYEFDRVFGPDCSQEEVYEDVKPLVTSVMDGYNVCIFAYGQTGSGKTYTMEGEPKVPGINPRTIQELFNTIEERKDSWDYVVKVSVVEIYNENVYDLLRKNPRDEKLDVRQIGKGLNVPGLTLIEVNDKDRTLEILKEGYKNRAVGQTKVNEHSSRSHCMLLVWIEGVNRISSLKLKSRLNLVDLAGSERPKKSGATGDRLEEAKKINLSLTSLGDVISKLMEKNRQHIPYRNSKLTIILQDSLGGDSKVNMFVNVSPARENAEETLSSLNFATRVRSVELGEAKANVSRIK